MRVGVLTSSRADFGIYMPLLKEIQKDDFFELKTIVFGTHLSAFHGYTKTNIEAAGFAIDYEIESMMLSDSKEAISTAMGLTMTKFANFWETNGNKFDIVLCLGDRYEMFAAVLSALPFSIQFAHLHGGEKTLGAIDNVFRHALTHASVVHFTACELYKERVEALLDEPKNIYNVGALSLDNILQIDLLDKEEFKQKWNIDMDAKTALMTFHSETVKAEKNIDFAHEVVKLIKQNKEIQFLITMPNADTAGNLIRQIFIQELSEESHVFMEENLGTQSYFSAMKHCKFLIGNTSSGILEAASFDKYVLNLGDRQKGRLAGENVIHTEINLDVMQKALDTVMDLPSFGAKNIFYNGGATSKIINALKSI